MLSRVSSRTPVSGPRNAQEAVSLGSRQFQCNNDAQNVEEYEFRIATDRNKILLAKESKMKILFYCLQWRSLLSQSAFFDICPFESLSMENFRSPGLLGS